MSGFKVVFYIFSSQELATRKDLNAKTMKTHQWADFTQLRVSALSAFQYAQIQIATGTNGNSMKRQREAFDVYSFTDKSE